MISYIDPTSGGSLVQLLFAGVSGLGVFLRWAWFRVRGMDGDHDPKDHPVMLKSVSAHKD